MLPVAQLLPAITAAAALPTVVGQAAGAFSQLFNAGAADTTSTASTATAELKNITPSRLSAGGVSKDDALVHETLRQSAADALQSFADQFNQALQAAGISARDLKINFGEDGISSDDPQTNKFLQELEAASPGIRQTLDSLYNNLKAMGAVPSQQSIQLQFESGRVEVFTAK